MENNVPYLELINYALIDTNELGCLRSRNERYRALWDIGSNLLPQLSIERAGSRFRPINCLDSDDVEDFLVEEGIGHFNRSGNFEYGPELYHQEDDNLGHEEAIESIRWTFQASLTSAEGAKTALSKPERTDI